MTRAYLPNPVRFDPGSAHAAPEQAIVAPSRAPRRVEVLAIAASSAFAGAALMSQTAVVPGWRVLDPSSFLHRFATSGPATGATAFGFEVAAMALLATAAAHVRPARRAERMAWLLSAACMAGTLVVLIYFVPTNLGLLHATTVPADVPATLAVWSRWNWLRTGLGLAAAALASAAGILHASSEDDR